MPNLHDSGTSLQQAYMHTWRRSSMDRQYGIERCSTSTWLKKILNRMQRRLALWVSRTVSYAASTVIAGALPADLTADGKLPLTRGRLREGGASLPRTPSKSIEGKRASEFWRESLENDTDQDHFRVASGQVPLRLEDGNACSLAEGEEPENSPSVYKICLRSGWAEQTFQKNQLLGIPLSWISLNLYDDQYGFQRGDPPSLLPLGPIRRGRSCNGSFARYSERLQIHP